MSRLDWRNIKVEGIHYEWIELKNMLLPMLRNKDMEMMADAQSWA
jgi:hypothetical protein